MSIIEWSIVAFIVLIFILFCCGLYVAIGMALCVARQENNTELKLDQALKRLDKSLYNLWEELEKDENYSKNPRIMQKLSELKRSSKN